MSPALLSKRLKQLEGSGVIRRDTSGDGGGPTYRLTQAGEDLRPVIMQLGFWGQRWIESGVSLKNLDPSLLMWDMRRNLDVSPMPERRCVIQFVYPEITSAKQQWWLVIDGGIVDLCQFDPGFPVDLYVETSLRTMTMIWMGLTTIDKERRAGQVLLDGDKGLAKSMQRWLGLSAFASEPKRTEGLVAQQAA